MAEQYKYWKHPKSGRYYIAYIDLDLLGDWAITCVWGGKGKRPSRVKHFYSASFEEAIVVLSDIEKRRLARWYTA